MSPANASDPRDEADAVVARVTARIAVFARDGRIAGHKFDKALDVFVGAGEIRGKIEAALNERGVMIDRLVEAPGSLPPPRGRTTTRPARKSASSRVTPREPLPVNDADVAVQAARALLMRDRIYGARPKRLLTAVEEVGLTRIIREGRSLQDPLPNGFRATIENDCEAARAFDAMMIHNVRLVWKIAISFLPRAQASGVHELEDLAQSGMTGLTRAVEMFDATKGYKFSTYATQWIRQAIGRELDDTGRLIRLPVHVQEDLRRIQTGIERVRMNGGVARAETVAEQIGMETAKVVRYLDYLRRPASLDLLVGDGDASLLEFVPTRYEDGPEYATVSRSQVEVFHDVLRTHLDPRSLAVMDYRFGLTNGTPMTLDEIGRIFKVTRERIRQIEVKAFKILRSEECLDALTSIAPQDLRHEAPDEAGA